MTQTCFDLQIDDRIAHLRMTRPEKRNSMIPEFWEELPRLIHDIDHNARARVIVISSTGPHFTGGLDIGAFMGGAEPGAQGVKAVLGEGAAFMAKLERMQETFSCLENARLPVIVAV
jgi:enoyl-CoA hydratase